MPKTFEELVQIHKNLHQGLDQLCACYIENTQKTLSDTTVMELIEWSHAQTMKPSCYVEPERNALTGVDEVALISEEDKIKLKGSV